MGCGQSASSPAWPRSRAMSYIRGGRANGVASLPTDGRSARKRRCQGSRLASRPRGLVDTPRSSECAVLRHKQHGRSIEGRQPRRACFGQRAFQACDLGPPYLKAIPITMCKCSVIGTGENAEMCLQFGNRHFFPGRKGSGGRCPCDARWLETIR